MIEVLVSVVLVCVGLLGIAALQSKAIPFTQDSVQRNTAIMLANDLMELIRTNPAEVANYLKAPGTAFGQAPSSCLPTPSSAADRLACWAARARLSLPGMTKPTTGTDPLTQYFYICKNATPGASGAAAACTGGNFLEIQVAWSTPSDACLDGNVVSGTDSSVICTYRLRTQL